MQPGLPFLVNQTSAFLRSAAWLVAALVFLLLLPVTALLLAGLTLLAAPAPLPMLSRLRAMLLP